MNAVDVAKHYRSVANESEIALLEAIEHAGSYGGAARLIGVDKETVRRRVNKIIQRGTQRGIAPDYDMTRPAPEGFCVKGVSTLYDRDGKIAAQWVKTKTDNDALRELLEDFTNRLSEKAKGRFGRITKAPHGDENLLAAYVVGDAHIGAYAWGEETGDDFDTNIATADLRGAFEHLSHAAPKAKVGLLVNVGDFLHANDTTSQTPNGKNLLDTDGRFSLVIDRAVSVFRDAVGMLLAKHEEVWIVNARGNHDPDAALWLNKVLEAYYSGEPRVTVLSNAPKFSYIEWGTTLVGIHHGDGIKRQQLYEAMTRDQRESWGKAKYTYFWTGHVHHKAAEEIGGCLFESFNTLAAPDAWHAGKGYGAGREMQQITLHRDYGIVGRNVCSLALARKET